MADEPVVASGEAAALLKQEPAVEVAKPEGTVLTAKPEGEVKPEVKPEGEAKPEVKPEVKPAAATVDPKAFKLPDGFTADEKQMGDFAALANEFKLPQDAAQKLVDLHAAALKTASEASSKYWGDKQTEWATANKTEFGPEPAKNPKIVNVSKMIDSLGEKPAAELREALEFSGMGNNPAIVKAFVAFAERFAEPAHAKGGPTGRPADIGAAFYPNMKEGT